MQNQRQGQYRPVAASKTVTNKEEQLINEILKDPNSNKESKKEQQINQMCLDKFNTTEDIKSCKAILMKMIRSCLLTG